MTTTLFILSDIIKVKSTIILKSFIEYNPTFYNSWKSYNRMFNKNMSVGDWVIDLPVSYIDEIINKSL